MTDMGSKNGTFLNGALILDERLEDGDRIEIGETKLDVYFPGRGRGRRDRDPEDILAQVAAGDGAGSPRSEARRREIRALTHLMELNEKINALHDEDQLLEGVLDAAIELTEARAAASCS